MPYGADGSGVPSRIKGAKARRQWAQVWNSTYNDTHDEGRAFAAANAVYNRRKNKKTVIVKLIASLLAKGSSEELYEDTGQYDEEHEDHLRSELEVWADYAEDGPTFDPEGKYLCGTCDMRMGEDNCMRVVSPIDFETGGCRIYVHGEEPEEGEAMPQKLTQIEAAYTERPEVKGFGCGRCMYGGEAKQEDSDGRKGWCSFWGCHVQTLACCFKNTGDDDVLAPVKGSKDKSSTEKAMLQQAAKAANHGEKELFCAFVKADAQKREVWGVVTAEEADKDDEVCDYETTVPYYKEMVAEMAKATDGANIFPLRAMHGLIAAGKGIAIEFRDDKKEVYMGFKVVDDNEWKKVEENVYTGFSQGGRYVKKWKDGDFTRYTAKPIEVSLVDVPCLKRATYDFVRADGTIEVRKFASAKQEGKQVDTLEKMLQDMVRKGACKCGCASCKAGDCTNCAADNKCSMSAKAVKYLVRETDGTGHLPYTDEDGSVNRRLLGAAWAALFSSGGHRGNKYAGPDKEKAKKRIKQIYASNGWDTPTEKLEHIDGLLKNMLEERIQNRAFGQLGKGMYTVSRFASLVEDLKYLWMSLEYEREAEGDDSPVTDELKETFSTILDHLLAYTEEQVEEEREKLTV